MTSSVIPKEKLSAYQRYEMASFGEQRKSNEQSVNEQQAAAALKQARADAHAEGYAEGLEQGRKAGMDAGRAEAAKETARLRKLADAFSSEVTKADEVVADEMLTLALDLAKAMLKTALAARPELMLPIVSEAIRYLPSVQQPALLALHPQDAQLVRSHMGDELDKTGWRIMEDKQMARGGCRVETASNQIDAAIETRWHRLAEALGRQSDWLE